MRVPNVRGSQYHQSNASLMSQLEHIDWWERNKWTPAQEKHMHGYVKLSGNRSNNRSLWDAWHDRGRAIYGMQGDIGKGKQALSIAQANKRGVSTLTSQGAKRSRDISALESWKRGFVSDTGAYRRETGKTLGTLGTRIGDLESRNFFIGDIEGLDEQLERIASETGTADEQLQKLIDQYKTDFEKETDAIKGDYLTKRSYEETMTENLRAAKDVLRGEWGQDIEQLDIGAIRDDIQAQRGDISALTRDWAGLGREVSTIDEAQRRADIERTKTQGQLDTLSASSAEEREQIRQSLRDQYTTLRGERGTELSQLEDKLVSDYSDKLLSLESGFDTDLAGVKSILGEDVARLTGEDVALSGKIGDVRSALEATQADVTSKFGDVTKGYTQAVGDVKTDLTDVITQQGADLSSQIEAAKSQGQEAIQDVYASRAEQLRALESDWGENLRAQEDVLQGRIDKGEEALQKRLSDLSASMNYRMLGDSTLGIKSRRSKAYRSGAVNRGTGQLSRGMKINTLNIA